ncbi:serine hydrolase domain-containing protein [Flavobacterium saccharophilum]|uniref:CubicO group peptidase, beta-lactamase class C family n=1 Tax=Flavobacterium saccharophilum TaxID=29534 RepID=A0A1M7CH37_9FLAO|nr:serine hydrolase domain-containing protein [Flavobacterium saccharophilum]SHL66578.1 CubicO group peptidase, beta-lactamase class C family [Flavobacterium saccharophilum]
MNRVSLLLLLSFTISIFSQQKQNALSENELFSIMDKNANLLLKDSKAYSVSIAIINNGKSHTKHYGEIDKGKGNKANDNTLFEIASVTKVFTGTLVANAVLEGKIKLDDDIRKYLKEPFSNLEYNGNSIRIRDLLTHRSGILTPFPDTKEIRQKYSPDSFLVHKNRLDKSYTKSDFFNALKKVKVDTLPGTTFKYGALGPELCAYILENVYNKAYEDQLNQVIFDKLKMNSTKIRLNNNDIVANGYNESGLLMTPLSSNLWGASKMLKSTISDLTKFIKFELDRNNKMVLESHRKIASNPDMGYFWEIQTDNNGNISYTKDGGSNGTQNILKIYPESNFGFIILMNQSDKNSGTYLELAVNNLLNDFKSAGIIIK